MCAEHVYSTNAFFDINHVVVSGITNYIIAASPCFNSYTLLAGTEDMGDTEG